MRRLDPRPNEVIDRDRPLRFRWNGKQVTGFAGDTIASALAASGVRVFSRSFKYHRPRGILTASYHDPNLMVQVGDEPNVRAGHRLVADGMDVRAQNAWPSLRFDVRSANRAVGRFLSPGFYYKTFIAPAPVRPWYQRTLRRFSSGGEVPAEAPFDPPEKRYAHPDVLVAGGGPAGMAAAGAAAAAGASVMLVEEEHGLGGWLRYTAPGSIPALDGVDVLTNSVVAGRFDHNWIGIVQRGEVERLIKARAKVLVVASGKSERPYVFAGNDLPGVVLSTAVRRLVNLWAVAPGKRAVVASANDSGDRAVADLESAGVEIAEIVEPQALVAARGRGGVERVELDGGKVVEADLLVTAAGWTTSTALLNMAGDVPAYDPAAARFLPGELPDDVMATGGVVGDGTLDELRAHGAATGREAARRALAIRARWQRATPRALPVEHPDTEPGDVPAVPPARHPALPPARHPELFTAATDGYVDFSEDVRAKDLAAAAAEGYDSIELSKRYTTATMGPVQGKLEVMNAVAVHAQATGSTIAATGTTTWRPPYAPITLGALAGHDHDPVRRSPLHDWHEAHGARPLVAGQWIRPDHYGDPAAEVRRTRDGVGIIDVSPLGKLDLRGADVPKLLDFAYTNRWGRLAVGRVRYGIMCAEDGVVMDDGVTARLDAHRWYMTTTSGGAGRVWNWLEDWLQTGFPAWDVRMTAVTDGYAAINVAGPRSRELLSGLVGDVDLSPGAFPYMHARTGSVAGVEGCRLLRIGFTGELSFEVHVPALHGLAVWEALVDAGAAAFGVEAQRIMRLEKGHFIVGQDTDGLTRAGSVAPWAVKLAKPDFAGKPELAWAAESGPARVLVALQPVDPALVPPEASQILDGERIVGRVTSARMSPTLGRSVCLAQLDAGLAGGGVRVVVRLPDGRDALATVLREHAHLDPEGARLHA